MYPERLLRRRFGTKRRLFWRIHYDIVRDRLQYWGTRRVVENRTSVRSTVKIMGCMRLLGIEDVYDSMDDGARIGEETVRIYLKRFMQDMKRRFGSYFLNRHTAAEEKYQIVGQYEDAGFPECRGCIYCTKLL